eukprot:s1327_g2.t1
MAGRPPFAFMPGMGADFDPMQLMFGQGGNIDPRILEEILGQAAAAGNWNAQAASDPSKKQAPGVSATALRNLPRVKVAAYDIAANESPECAISLEPLLIGAPAIRLPCGHLFYEDAVKDWLKKSNECPVCRWELPSDDAEHEQGRSQRMAGRKVRLRLTDLSVKTAAELRRFAHFLSVDVKDCLEKSELVEKISKSPQVQMMSADDEEASNHSVQSRCCDSDLRLDGFVAGRFCLAQLLRTCVVQRKAVLEKLRLRFRHLFRPTRWCSGTEEELLVQDGILEQRLRMARGYVKLMAVVSVATCMNVQWNIFRQNPRWMSTPLVWVIFFVATMSTLASARPQVLTPGNLDVWYMGGMLAVLAAMSPIGTSPDQAVLVSLVGLALYRLPAVTFATRQWLVVLLNVGFVVMYLDLTSTYVTMWVEIMNFTVICVTSFFLQKTLRSNMKQTIQCGKATKELNAASSLLQLTCDAVVELDEDLCVVAHSPELAAMLLRTRPGYSLEGVCFTDFIATPAEAIRVEQILLSNTAQKSDDSPDAARSPRWTDDSTAHAFHTRLMDSCSALGVLAALEGCSSKFRTEVFRVRYNGLDGRVRQLLGIRDFTDEAALAASAIDAASPSRGTPMHSTSLASFAAPSSEGLSSHASRRRPSSMDKPEGQDPMDQIAHLALDVPSETVTAASPAVSGLEGKPFGQVFTHQGMEVMRSLWKDILELDKQGVLAGKQISIGDLQVLRASGALQVSGHVELLRLRGSEMCLLLCFKVPPAARVARPKLQCAVAMGPPSSKRVAQAIVSV